MKMKILSFYSRSMSLTFFYFYLDFIIMIQDDGPEKTIGGELISDLEDAVVKQRANYTSGFGLVEARKNRLQSHMQHRLSELEGYYF